MMEVHTMQGQGAVNFMTESAHRLAETFLMLV